MVLALMILAYLILPATAIWAVQKQIRRSRFTQIERDFFASWTHLPPETLRTIVARAWTTEKLPNVPGESLDQLMARALHERWQAMCDSGEFDFDLLREDLDRLLLSER